MLHLFKVIYQSYRRRSVPVCRVLRCPSSPYKESLKFQKCISIQRLGKAKEQDGLILLHRSKKRGLPCHEQWQRYTTTTKGYKKANSIRMSDVSRNPR